MAYILRAVERSDRYKVKVSEYVHYRREGYLKVPALLPPEDVRKLVEWANARWEASHTSSLQ